MWFKNLYLFKFEEKPAFDAEKLQSALEAKPFKPCQPTQRVSLGWEAPLGKASESLVHAVNDCYLISLARQERLLPATVVREELENRLDKIESEEDRRPRGKEKKALREAIEFELLPQAFTRTSKLDAWIDVRSRWLIINSASAKRAEELSGLLRQSLGSLPVVLAQGETDVSSIMTGWIKQGAAVPPFSLGQECQFQAAQGEEGIASFRQYDLLTDEIGQHAAAGQALSRLELEWDEKLRFVLTDEWQIRKLRFLDVMEEQLQDYDPQSQAEQLDIEFAIMTGEVSNLLNDLQRVL